MTTRLDRVTPGREVRARLATRAWVPSSAEELVNQLATAAAARDADHQERELLRLIERNRHIHERDCINLNPGTNVMNPRAEALLAAGLGSRPSLGYPGEKYEMGLDAIERIEVQAAELAAEVFDAKYVELRVASGALANAYAFLACSRPGAVILAPPARIGGHVTHHLAGAAGLLGLEVHEAEVDETRYTVDVEGVRAQARRLRPSIITIGGSLNLEPHPVAALREVADEVGATLLYDAAHVSGMIAGHAWQQPLAEGAHVMTMSTYKSLGGPPSGLLLTNDPAIAERVDRIAHPGLTANFDAGKTAALTMTLLDWQVHGRAYASAMAATATALATALEEHHLPVFRTRSGATRSHQFALDARPWGGGQTAARLLERAKLLSCGIGLPLPGIDGDLNGLRLGSNEIVRRGMGPEHMPELADAVARVLAQGEAPERVAADVTALRRRFSGLAFVRP